MSAVVDSGAEDNALPETVGEWLPLTPSDASKAGRKFTGAGGDDIPAKGRRVTNGLTAQKATRKISWEVCPVKRPLLSVMKLTAAGNVVNMGKDSACIINQRTREVTPLRRERNVWILDMWIKKPAGFPRQE